MLRKMKLFKKESLGGALHNYHHTNHSTRLQTFGWLLGPVLLMMVMMVMMILIVVMKIMMMKMMTIIMVVMIMSMTLNLSSKTAPAGND